MSSPGSEFVPLIPIRVQIDPKVRSSLPTVENLRVATAAGASVPLSAVAEFKLASGPATITRLDRICKATVEAELNGLPLGEALQMIRALPVMKGLPPTVREQQTGDAEIMIELFSSFAIALGAGVLLVYTVMVVLFGGFVQPLTIMMALPLSLGGAMLFLLASGMALSISAVIGVMMLMGIVAKNSILLAETTMVPEITRNLLGIGTADARSLAPHEALALADKPNVALVDVREADEIRRMGKVKCALHIPRGDIERRAHPHSPTHVPA